MQASEHVSRNMQHGMPPSSVPVYSGTPTPVVSDLIKLTAKKYSAK
jgi:hypothetical protein